MVWISMVIFTQLLLLLIVDLRLCSLTCSKTIKMYNSRTRDDHQQIFAHKHVTVQYKFDPWKVDYQLCP